MDVYRKVHHYPAGPGRRIINTVPRGSKILSAAFRNGAPVVYLEEVFGPGGAGGYQTLDALFVSTGDAFTDHDLDFIGTVVDERHGLFWHVYGKIA